MKEVGLIFRTVINSVKPVFNRGTNFMNCVCAYDLIIIIMYIYHMLINVLSAHMIHVNLSIIFYTHVGHSPTKIIYKKYYTEKQTHTLLTHTHTHTRTHTHRNEFKCV